MAFIHNNTSERIGDH